MSSIFLHRLSSVVHSASIYAYTTKSSEQMLHASLNDGTGNFLHKNGSKNVPNVVTWIRKKNTSNEWTQQHQQDVTVPLPPSPNNGSWKRKQWECSQCQDLETKRSQHTTTTLEDTLHCCGRPNMCHQHSSMKDNLTHQPVRIYYSQPLPFVPLKRSVRFSLSAHTAKLMQSASNLHTLCVLLPPAAFLYALTRGQNCYSTHLACLGGCDSMD